MVRVVSRGCWPSLEATLKVILPSVARSMSVIQSIPSAAGCGYLHGNTFYGVLEGVGNLAGTAGYGYVEGVALR